MTGKRTPLLASIITLFIYSINRLKNLFSILIGFSGVLFLAFKLGLLRRIVNPLQAYDIELSADFFLIQKFGILFYMHLQVEEFLKLNIY